MVNEVILLPRRRCWSDLPAQIIRRRGVRTKHRHHHHHHHRHPTLNPRVVVHGTILGTPAAAILQRLAAGENIEFFQVGPILLSPLQKAFPSGFCSRWTGRINELLFRYPASEQIHLNWMSMSFAFYIGRRSILMTHHVLLSFTMGGHKRSSFLFVLNRDFNDEPQTSNPLGSSWQKVNVGEDDKYWSSRHDAAFSIGRKGRTSNGYLRIHTR
ncbi:hypothetical protein CLAIMM_10282 [Cladophialophora immunda]|nr:hypothetical protein CLAIMM_10282 [Cladophialophora immunda]